MNTKLRKLFTRTVSTIIVMVMIIGSFPFSILAGEADENNDQDAKAYSDALSAADDQTDYQLIPDLIDLVNVADDADEPDAADGNDDAAKGIADDLSNEPDTKKDPSAGTVKAAPDDGNTLGRLTISRNGTEFPSGNSYVLSEAEGKGFFVNYRYSSLEDTVLVVECLDIGADFAAVPQTNEFFNQVAKLGQGKIALRFNNSPNSNDCTVNFLMKSVALTEEQVFQLIDCTTLPTSRIAVTEYTLPSSTSLSKVLDEGIKGDEQILWEGTPYFNPDATVTAPNPYQLTVSPVSDETGSLTNYYFDEIGKNDEWGNLIYNGYKNGSYRFKLPSAYNDGGSLMEILKVRLYEPTDLIYLRAIELPGGEMRGNTWPNCQLSRGEFDKYWNGWTVGERTYDPDKNAYFYEMTPKERFINSDTFGKTQLYTGMTLRWRMTDNASPLAPGTSYLAENTVITYRLPGDGTNVRTAEVRGSEIVTGSISYREPKTVLPEVRDAKRNPVTDQDVRVGEKYTEIGFSTIYNSMVVTPKSTVLPSYTGQVTQLYEFPYQIQPTKLTLKDERRLTNNTSTKTSELAGIYYNTWDDDSWVAVDQDTIDNMNSVFHRHSGENNFVTVGTFAFPEDVVVKTVRIEWSRLGTMMRRGHGCDHDYATAITYFDFKVDNWTDKTHTAKLKYETQVNVLYRESYDGIFRNGETFKPSIVNANMMLAGQDAPSAQDVEQYLWFRLVAPKEEICPDLYGRGGSESLPYSINGGKITSVGDLGIAIGKYGDRYDYIHNPVITLKLINLKNEIANATDEQLLALFTGRFTAMPKLSGWTFDYTAENSNHDVYTNRVTIPEITGSGQKEDWLPLPEGYAFTSVVLSYDGEFDLMHSSETDTNTVVWLMTDILLKRYDDIPYLDKKIYVNKDNGYAEIRLNGTISFDITVLADENGLHCKCNDDAHVSGKDMVFNTSRYDFRVYSTRKASISVTGKKPEKAVIYQGESVGDASSENAATTWDTSNFAVITGEPTLFNEGGEYGIRYSGAIRVLSNGQRYVSYHRYFPIDDINEYLYIELTDEEFIPNLQYSTLWGYPLTDKNVYSEIISVNDADGNPHRFLKLHFDEDFIRTKVYQQVDGTWTWRDKGVLSMNPDSYYDDGGQNVIKLDGKLYHEDNLTGPFKLAFDTVPGTTPGEHHPVGMIYYDLTDFINQGHASVNQPDSDKNGYDRDRTYYVFSGNNIVDDTMGLSGDTSRKFFYQDGSSWTVEVLMHQEIGASLAPGKNMTYYDFSNGYRRMEFDYTEKDNLNAFLTITGPGNINASPIYDMSTIVVIPRDGKEITYTHSTTVDGVQQDVVDNSYPSDFSMYMRGTPYIVSNTTGIDPVMMYTTAGDPTDGSAVWMNSDEVSDWKSITGIKVVLSVMNPTTSLNLRLNLATDDEVDYKNQTKLCYAGGTFEYRVSQDGNIIAPQHINLSEWDYHGYVINCQVFWDTYDEDGSKSIWYEDFIKGVPVTIYDPSGNPIPQDDGVDTVYTSNYNASTYLFIPYYEKGQYIVTGTPNTNDGSIVKMTVYPEGRFISFDRDANKVVFKQPQYTGWGGMDTILIGFVKLPQIEAPDIEMYVGDTVSSDSIVKEFVSNTYYNDNKNILTNGTYKIDFKGIDKSIATFKSNGKLVDKDNRTLLSNYSFTGVAGGKFTVDATVSNRLGDKATTTFTVIVRELEDIVVTNIWDDDNNRDGIRPDGVTVQLMKNGVAEGDPVVLNDANNNTYTWPKMVRIDENGDEVEYTLKVTPIAAVPGHTGYTQTVDKSSYIADLTATAGGYRFTVKNVHIPEKVDLKVSKVWDDNNNSDKIRPESIKVGLSDGTLAELNEGNNWTYLAKDRYKYENGKEIKYKWKEVKVPDGYTLKINESGYITTLVNTHVPMIDVIVTNVWDDDNNRDGIRPDGVTVRLMKNGNAASDPVFLSEKNNNTFTWSKLPRFNEKGEEIEYALKVTPVAAVPGHTGYTQTVDKSGFIADLTASAGGYRFKVVNVHIPEKVDLKVSKVWDDNNDSDRIRPESIKVELSDGTRAELNEGNKWTYVAKDRFKYENGKEIKYTWKEVNVPDGYTLKITGSTYDTKLVNTHVPNVIDVIVNNVWDDDNNRDGIRPDGVTVRLMKNGEAVGDPIVLSEKNKNTYTWSDLPRFNKNGDEFEYTISPEPIPEVPGHTGYTQTVDKSSYGDVQEAASAGYRFTVTNVHIPERVDPKVTKVWDDEDDRDGIRPGSIKVELSDGTRAELNDSNKWTYVAKNRYKYENGKEIKYTWTEVNVPDGYELTVTGSGCDTTLVNKHVPATVERTVVAVWIDDNDRDGIRPKNLKVGFSDCSSVTINEKISWTVTVQGLKKYEEGQLIDYSWIAPEVPDGYSFSQTVEGTVTTLTYVHKRTGKKVTSTGEKIAVGSVAACVLIPVSVGMAVIALRGLRKREEE